MLVYNPKRRYSAVVMFSDDLEHVLLIHKLKPDWQAGKANFPGGKVEERDFSPNTDAYAFCATRELAEETGIFLGVAQLKLFCRLRFTSREGDEAECCFFTARGPVFDAQTKEVEQVFTAEVHEVIWDEAGYYKMGLAPYVHVPVMPELPWLAAMAKEALETNCAPRTVYQ